MPEFGYEYIARVEKDITGAIHLHIILPEQVVELSVDDEEYNKFVVVATRVELESA
jgi:hypothetical protein